MAKITFIAIMTLVSNIVIACGTEKVEIAKYVTDSKVGTIPIPEGCRNVNFLLAPKFINEGLYLEAMVVNIIDSSATLLASIPLAISEDSGYRVANACLSEFALKHSELEFIFMHKAQAQLTDDGHYVVGGMACHHTEKVQLTSLLEIHNKAQQ